MQLEKSVLCHRRSQLFYSVLSLVLVLLAVTNLYRAPQTTWIPMNHIAKNQHHIPADMIMSSGDPENISVILEQKNGVANSVNGAHSAFSLNGFVTSSNDFGGTQVVTTKTTQSFLFPPARIPPMYVRNIKLGKSRLGNIMFEYIGTYLTALRLGLKFVVMADGVQLSAYQQLSSLFKVSAPIFMENFPNDSVIIREQGFGVYTPAFLKPETYQPYTQIRAYLQSWRYFAGFEQFVRKELTLRDRYVSFVNKFFAEYDIRLEDADRGESVTLIAVHVRRGDFLDHLDQYKVATPQYLVQAILYFREKYATQQPTFVVATDDVLWTQGILESLALNVSLKVIYANGTAEEDLAVLSSCHHAIITSGTYSWWIAWLTGGNVMYFRDYIWNGSVFWGKFNAEDYYPAPWIGRS